jgi:amidase
MSTNPDEHTWRPSRREFLGYGAAGGALLLAGPVSCQVEDRSTAAAVASQKGSVAGFELDELTIDQLADGQRTGRWTARSITERYLERIDSLNLQGPELRAVIEINPDALAIADALDEERAGGTTRGPLHGIPILLKDNIATEDRMETTAGSYALIGSRPTADAFVARRLREVGAVLLGKANLSEWANFRSSRSSSGWSGRGGQCRNPHVLDRNPCGSSSGSAVSVSANLAAVAIGTETDGSVVCPSSACGIVGIKPTVGLVSRSRIVPISHSQDTAGPMARTIRDAALVLGAMVGVDTDDAATEASRAKAYTDYTQFLDAAGLSGARVGVARDYLGFHDRVDILMEDAIEAMRTAGAEVIDPVEITTRRDIGEHEYQVLLYEFKANLNAYLAELGGTMEAGTLEQLMAYNEANRDREMPWFGQERFQAAQEKGPLTEPEYLDALATSRRLARTEGIDATMDRHRLDAIVAPTGGPAWTTDLVNGDHFGGGSSSAAAVAGYPNVTVPAGFVHGLPVGISFFGRAWSEPVLLPIAYAFEQATQHRRAPGFEPTVA